MFDSANRSVCCMVSVQGMLQIYSILEPFLSHISIDKQNIQIYNINLTLIQPLSFILKMFFAFYICCIYSSELQTRV